MSKMPKSRRTLDTAAQKQQSPRTPPLRLKPTASSQSKSRHGSSKIEDARPSRSPLHEKQHGTQVAELKVKLGEALEELEKLRERLVAAESSKREVQKELEETKIQNRLVDRNLKEQEKRNVLQELEAAKEHIPIAGSKPTIQPDVATPAVESSLVTDVFEVVPVLIQMDLHNSHLGNQAVEERKLSAKEMDSLMEENGRLKKELEAVREAATAVGTKLVALEEELRDRSEFMERQGEHLEAAEGTKAALQEEMKRVCMRSDQWRKAAEAALAALYGGGGKGAEMEGVLMGLEDGRWKGMFGDLWRKKGQ